MRGALFLWTRRVVIVLTAMLWAVYAFSVVGDLIAHGPTEGYGGVRIRSASSNVGTLIFLIIAAPIGGFWAIRNWNRGRETKVAPMKRRRNRKSRTHR